MCKNKIMQIYHRAIKYEIIPHLVMISERMIHNNSLYQVAYTLY